MFLISPIKEILILKGAFIEREREKESSFPSGGQFICLGTKDLSQVGV